MGIFTRGSKSKGTEIQSLPERGGRMGLKDMRFIEQQSGVAIHNLKRTQDYLDVGTKEVWASFRACHLIASFFLTTKFQVEGKSTGAVIENPELAKLMSTPNPYDSWEDLLYQWVFHMKLTGSAYWVKDQMDSKGRPLYLYALLPQYVQVYPDPTNKISHYIYKVNGQSIRFERAEVIMFRRAHPSKSIEGLGDVEAGQSLFVNTIMKSKLEEKFVHNGARPSGILSREEVVEDQTEWDKIKMWWDKSYGGVKNAGKTAFLNGKWTYNQLGLSPTEMQSMESQNQSVKDIATLHGVPLSIFGIEGAANYATSKQDEINFRKYEIVPLADMFVGRMNMGLAGTASFIQSYSDQWVLAYSMSGLIDVGGIIADYVPLVDAGAMTLNELREIVGLGRIENPLLDQFYMGQARVPIELVGYTAPTEGDLQKAVTISDKVKHEAIQQIMVESEAGRLSAEGARARIDKVMLS